MSEDFPNRSEPTMEIDEEEEDGGGNRLVLPEDGYEWKKYGQKFIKSIEKYRSYFKCQKSNCSVKKRAEWSSSDPCNIRVTYDGVHTHASSSSPQQPTSSTSSTSTSNQYNLFTQVFGPKPPSRNN